MLSDDDEDDEQPDEGTMVGLKILFGTRVVPAVMADDLKLLFTSQFLDKNFESFIFVIVVATLALCCSKTMAVFRVLLLRSFFVVVVETRLKL